MDELTDSRCDEWQNNYAHYLFPEHASEQFVNNAEKLLESACNILRDGVIAKYGESDTIDDWMQDYAKYKNEINTMNELIEKTRQWFHDKGIIANSTPLKQLNKSQEELTETRDAVIRHEYAGERVVQFRLDEIKDGIGDTVVTLIGVCEMYGFALEECLQMAYDTISKRTGKMIDGVFVRDN